MHRQLQQFYRALGHQRVPSHRALVAQAACFGLARLHAGTQRHRYRLLAIQRGPLGLQVQGRDFQPHGARVHPVGELHGGVLQL